MCCFPQPLALIRGLWKQKSCHKNTRPCWHPKQRLSCCAHRLFSPCVKWSLPTFDFVESDRECGQPCIVHLRFQVVPESLVQARVNVYIVLLLYFEPLTRNTLHGWAFLWCIRFRKVAEHRPKDWRKRWQTSHHQSAAAWLVSYRWAYIASFFWKEDTYSPLTCSHILETETTSRGFIVLRPLLII